MSSGAELLWVGGYSAEMDGTATGIRVLRRLAEGRLDDLGVAAPSTSPSFLARSGETLYAAGESGASVSAFAVAGSRLDPLGIRDAAGPAPCSLAVIDDLLITASYGDGAVGVHRLDSRRVPGPVVQVIPGQRVSGGVAPGPREAQDGPHAHDVLSYDRGTVLTTDLGTDSVHVLARRADGLTRVATVAVPAGSGPRDLWRHPSGAVWVLAELSCELIVLVPADGTFTVVGRVPLPGAAAGDHAAGIAVDALGRFAYIGLRGSNRVSVLRVPRSDDAHAAAPAAVASVASGGDGPRHLVVAAGVLYVANQLSNGVASFRLRDDGIPELLCSTAVPSPTFLLPGGLDEG